MIPFWAVDPIPEVGSIGIIVAQPAGRKSKKKKRATREDLI
ncbi:MAG: hypothetical protein MPW14_10090 [Candidatus Manganitrophus sp.]|nr:MAG: hypothetical protein MPW14_10090 [Candidatus Manganitrophus sp.]